MESEKEELNGSLVTQDYIDSLRKKSNGFRMQESEFDRKRVQTGTTALLAYLDIFYSSTDTDHNRLQFFPLASILRGQRTSGALSQSLQSVSFKLPNKFMFRSQDLSLRHDTGKS